MKPRDKLGPDLEAARAMFAAKDAVRAVHVMCGCCKATGVEHVWNAEAHLVPTDPPKPCHGCNGTGRAIREQAQ